MTTFTTTAARGDTNLLAIAGAILAGALLLFVAGFAQVASAHGPTHDQRHAVAFPCH